MYSSYPPAGRPTRPLLNSYGRGPKSPGRVTSDATTTTNEYRTNAGGSVVGGDYIHGRAVPTRRNTEEKRRPENTVVTNNNSIQIRRRLGSRTFGPLIITVANRGRFPTSLTARAGIRPPPLYTHTHTHTSRTTVIHRWMVRGRGDSVLLVPSRGSNADDYAYNVHIVNYVNSARHRRHQTLQPCPVTRPRVPRGRTVPVSLRPEPAAGRFGFPGGRLRRRRRSSAPVWPPYFHASLRFAFSFFAFKLDDAALQLYKDGDFGSYLDMEASISEQPEDFDGFQNE